MEYKLNIYILIIKNKLINKKKCGIYTDLVEDITTIKVTNHRKFMYFSIITKLIFDTLEQISE